MDGLQASILNVKIQYLESWTKRRIQIANLYLKELEGVGDLLLPYASKNTHHVYHLFTIFTKYRDKLNNYLNDKGIGTTINYPIPLPLLPCYSHLRYSEKDFPVSSLVCKSILSLPLYPELKDDDQDYVIKVIKEFFNLI
tara:strand:- start:367 stop:786 length:420 start_codon:yes stop_codon:yes gene_type:complete